MDRPFGENEITLNTQEKVGDTQGTTINPIEDNPRGVITNKKLSLFVKINIVAYLIPILMGFVLGATNGFKGTGDAGLVLLPFLLVAWALTPIGVICLIALAVRTKKPVYIVFSLLVLATPFWLYLYDKLTK